MQIISKLQTLLIVAAMAAGTFASADNHGPKIGGFIDAQYKFEKGPYEINSTSYTGRDNTFAVFQGALTFSHEMGNSSVHVDLAFSNYSAMGTATTGFSTVNNRSQAFVMNKYDNGLWWKLGQWDTIYGLDANDVIDTPFNTVSLHRYVLPVTHQGLLLGYKMGDLGFNFHLSNSNQTTPEQTSNKTAGVTTTSADAAKGEMGVKFTYANDMMNGRLGYMMQQYDGDAKYNITGGTESLSNETTLDLGLGAMFGAIGVDFQYVSISNFGGLSKNTAGKDADAVANLMLQAKYAMGKHSFALRFETLENYNIVTGMGGNTLGQENDFKAQRIALGMTHKCNDHMMLKADVFQDTLEDKGTETKDDSALGAAISASYRF